MRRMPGLILLCLPWLCAAQPETARVRALVLTGETDLPYHDWRQTTPFLKGILAGTGRFEVKVLEEVRGVTAATLASHDVLVLNYNGPRWGEATERAVEEFIRSGKGMIAVHGVSYGHFFGMVMKERWTADPAGDPGWTAYADMLGSTWKPENIGHGARHIFPVKWVDTEHPISKGLEPVFMANDELYHRMDLKPNAHVLARAYSDPKTRGTGREEPVIWTTSFGQGRVVHMTLGHDLSAMVQTGFATAFARGAEWAATGKVTLPVRIEAIPSPASGAVRVLAVTGGHSFPTAFFGLFEGYDDIAWTHAGSPREAFTARMAERFDVVVLHDMHEDLAEPQRDNLRRFVESGKGVVSTHHAIVNYTAWPWWHEEVVGGKFFTKATPEHPQSEYKEHVEMVVLPAAGQGAHPILRGVGPLPLVDETYRKMWHSPRITVLMETSHALNDRPVVYIGPHPKARVIYIQPGHGEETLKHPGYRRLVRNAILWAAGR